MSFPWKIAGGLALCCVIIMDAMAQERTSAVSAEQTRQWAELAAKMALTEVRAWDIRLEKEDGPQAKLVEQPVLKSLFQKISEPNVD